MLDLFLLNSSKKCETNYFVCYLFFGVLFHAWLSFYTRFM